jgi:hypothetical protein
MRPPPVAPGAGAVEGYSQTTIGPFAPTGPDEWAMDTFDVGDDKPE